MTSKHWFAIAALALAAPAGGSIPGNEETLARAGLQHVCVDVEPGADDYVLCVEQEGDATSFYTASECVTAGLPAVCVVDMLPKPRLKGRLFLIQDQDAQNEAGDAESAAGIVFELKVKGKKHVLIELFDGDTDGTRIGNWNDLDEALLVNPNVNVDFSNDDQTVFQFASRTLENVGFEIRDLAAAAWPNLGISGAIPVFLAFDRGPESGIVDHSLFTELLASGAPFEITLGFARVRP